MANKNVGTYDTAQINLPLVILRKVDFRRMDPKTVELIGASATGYKMQESELLWFRDGFILNDQPRLEGVVGEIMQHTLDFAVGRPDNGMILAEDMTLQEAEGAVADAKITLGIGVKLPRRETIVTPVEAGV